MNCFETKFKRTLSMQELQLKKLRTPCTMLVFGFPKYVGSYAPTM